MRRTEVLENGCWSCDFGLHTQNGYAMVWVQRPEDFNGQLGKVPAHRIVYTLLVGPIDDEMGLDHLCHTRDASCPGGNRCPHRRCVNPEHLEPLPDPDNVLRGRGPLANNARKLVCIRGHPLSGDNVYVASGGGRGCRECKRMADRARIAADPEKHRAKGRASYARNIERSRELVKNRYYRMKAKESGENIVDR